MLEADFVIIGSGSAGSAMAYRLSEDGKHSVVVIEFGGTDIGPLIQMPSALSIPLNMAALFAFGYVAVGGIAGARPGSLADAFFFSVQTMGTIGYGVFTYALAKEFRKAQTARETDVSFTELRKRVNATMKTLHYDQISDVKGPKGPCRAPVLGAPGKTRAR